MRRLADAAGVSVTTVYNLVGGRDEVLGALALDVLDRVDRAAETAGPADPLERAWWIVEQLVGVVVADVPPALVAAVLADEDLAASVFARWRGAGALAGAFADLAAAGSLDGRLSPARLADQALHGLTRALRLWGEGRLDDRRFSATARYGLDVALAAGASPELRDRVTGHARRLERSLPR
jgi:AcrR family transcriptional regulator